jgi:non-heme chloroperoxidase
MLRRLYNCAVRLHPSSFRRRFGDEMLHIFDQQKGRLAAVGLMLDCVLSLLRQWTLRSHIGIELSGAPLLAPTADDIPSFETLDAFRPRASAIIHGMVLSLILFCMTVFAIRYSWIRVLNLRIPEVAVGTSAQPVDVIPTEPNHPQRNDAQSKTMASSPPTRPLSRDFEKSSEHLRVDIIPNEGVDLQSKAVASSSPRTPAVSLPARGAMILFDSHAGKYIFRYPPAKISPIDGTWVQGSYFPLELQRATIDTSWLTKSSIRWIAVAPSVSLEVIDWGGSGPPLIFLAGLGNTAHIFDNFAPKFVPKYHAYGITRRGFGASSSAAPDGSNYSADQLGDDVLKVMDALGLKKPVLIGHSIAGEELSSIGSRYPDKVAGLIYLDAGYPYALYSPESGDSQLDAEELQNDLKTFLSRAVLSGRVVVGSGADQKETIAKMLAGFPRLQKDLEADRKRFELMPRPPTRQTKAEPPFADASAAIIMGEQKYTNIQAPILAIFASPHSTAGIPRMPDEKKSEWIALDQAKSVAQAKAFEKLKSAKVVIIPNADHFVFFSNEQEVEKNMKDFLMTLKSEESQKN